MITTFNDFILENTHSEENQSLLKKVAGQFDIDLGFITTFSLSITGFLPLCTHILNEMNLNGFDSYSILCIILAVFCKLFGYTKPELKNLIDYIEENGWKTGFDKILQILKSTKKLFSYIYDKLTQSLDFVSGMFPYIMLFVVFEKILYSLYSVGSLTSDDLIHIGFGIGVTVTSSSLRFIISDIYRKLKSYIIKLFKKTEEFDSYTAAGFDNEDDDSPLDYIRDEDIYNIFNGTQYTCNPRHNKLNGFDVLDDYMISIDFTSFNYDGEIGHPEKDIESVCKKLENITGYRVTWDYHIKKYDFCSVYFYFGHKIKDDVEDSNMEEWIEESNDFILNVGDKVKVPTKRTLNPDQGITYDLKEVQSKMKNVFNLPFWTINRINIRGKCDFNEILFSWMIDDLIPYDYDDSEETNYEQWIEESNKYDFKNEFTEEFRKQMDWKMGDWLTCVNNKYDKNLIVGKKYLILQVKPYDSQSNLIIIKNNIKGIPDTSIIDDNQYCFYTTSHYSEQFIKKEKDDTEETNFEEWIEEKRKTN